MSLDLLIQNNNLDLFIFSLAGLALIILILLDNSRLAGFLYK